MYVVQLHPNRPGYEKYNIKNMQGTVGKNIFIVLSRVRVKYRNPVIELL